MLKVGDTMELFPVLADWTTEELQALLKDVEQFTEAQSKAIEEAWKKIVLRPEVFFSKPISAEIDKMRNEKQINVISVMSEICSVAIFYLCERGVSVE